MKEISKDSTTCLVSLGLLLPQGRNICRDMEGVSQRARRESCRIQLPIGPPAVGFLPLRIVHSPPTLPLVNIWTCACCLSFILLVGDQVDAQENSTHVSATTATPATTHHSQSSVWNYEMLHRAFYVLIGISVLAVFYFVIRTCSIKKKPQRKKYGLLSDYDENMEMGSMESDEEKIFESRNIRR